MDWTDRRERLRSVIAGPRCIYPGSVFDAISARIAEDLDFEAGMLVEAIPQRRSVGRLTANGLDPGAIINR